jgi:beta-glucosidase
LLAEDPGLAENDLPKSTDLIVRGKATGPWRLVLRDPAGETGTADVRGLSPAGQLEVKPADNQIQEDTIIASWNGSARLVVKGAPADFRQQVEDGQVLEVIYKVIEADVKQASLAMGQGAVDITAQVNGKTAEGWQTSRIRLSCFAKRGAQMSSLAEPLIIFAEGTLKLQITSARLITFAGAAACDE